MRTVAGCVCMYVCACCSVGMYVDCRDANIHVVCLAVFASWLSNGNDAAGSLWMAFGCTLEYIKYLVWIVVAKAVFTDYSYCCNDRIVIMNF